MKVTLLTYTPDALNILLYTKNTRLRMTGVGLEEIRAWPESKKQEELEYMKNTIQSSWEFVDYMFAIEGVTRAFTHQLVRHRVGTSFAQQAQRVVNMEGFEFLATGPMLGEEGSGDSETRKSSDWGDFSAASDYAPDIYNCAMGDIERAYNRLMDGGVPPQDARGILPTNICTNIVFKANLRTLHEMALKRLCVKAQGEFQDVFRELVARVAEVHPWAEEFLRVQCAWNGTCLFPSLPVEQCHVKPIVFDHRNAKSYGESQGLHSPHEAHIGTIEEIYQLHRAKRTEIQPVVKA